MKKGYSTATLVTEGGLEGVAKLDHTCRMGLAAVSLNGKRILGLIEQNQPEFLIICTYMLPALKFGFWPALH